MTEANALQVSNAAISAWLPELTAWICLKKANHAGLDTPKARSKSVHRCDESAIADAPARRRPKKQNRRQGQLANERKKEEQAAKQAEA